MLQDWYIHAVTVVDSRALTIRGRKYLVPFADMFNYAPHAASRAADRGSHFLKYHVLGDTTFTVLADRTAQPGEQLFEDYGDNENTMSVLYACL
jgi:histone-lysine N-methyltransferase SETD3